MWWDIHYIIRAPQSTQKFRTFTWMLISTSKPVISHIRKEALRTSHCGYIYYSQLLVETMLCYIILINFCYLEQFSYLDKQS